MTVLVAPTEPVALRQAGSVSMWPETVGCDVVVFAGGRKIGVQRKEVADLLASLDDGRLALQLAQMKGSVLDQCVVVIEGDMEYVGAGADGTLVQRWRGGREWTRSQIMAVEWGIRGRGIHVAHTDGLDETVCWVQTAEKWWGKERHGTLSRRPKAPTKWGTAMS